MTALALLASLLAAQDEAVTLRYADRATRPAPVSIETRMALKIEGTDQATDFIRSAHPIMSLQNLRLTAEGTRRVTLGKQLRLAHREARVEAKYDDEKVEVDFTFGDPPPADLAKNKLLQMLWAIAALGRTYELSPEGKYRSAQKDQDHTGEAMDLITLGITRLPGIAVRQGESYTVSWKGSRAERNKSGVFAFTQKTTVDAVAKVDGRTVATLSSALTGELQTPDSERDPTAEEAWTRCKGTTKIRIDVASGLVLSSEGKGNVTTYFRGPAEDGSKNELKLTIEVEGKISELDH